MLQIPSGATAVQELLEKGHARQRGNRDGAVADAIPELARADAEGFGIALATPDGRPYTVRGTNVPFTIQSISKPFADGLALKRRSGDPMARTVGWSPPARPSTRSASIR